MFISCLFAALIGGDYLGVIEGLVTWECGFDLNINIWEVDALAHLLLRLARPLFVAGMGIEGCGLLI